MDDGRERRMSTSRIVAKKLEYSWGRRGVGMKQKRTDGVAEN